LTRVKKKFLRDQLAGRAFQETGKIPSPETAALNDEPAPYAKPE
jgi:hypothetical protein